MTTNDGQVATHEDLSGIRLSWAAPRLRRLAASEAEFGAAISPDAEGSS